MLNVTMSHVTMSTLGPMDMKENGALADGNGALADGNGLFGKEFETYRKTNFFSILETNFPNCP